MENETLNPHESLNLITKMIHQAKGNVQNNSFYFILWGYTAAIANVGTCVLLLYTNYRNASYIWLITIPVGILSYSHAHQDSKVTKIKTPLDATIRWIWIAYCITIVIIICSGKSINFQINPMILIVSALPTLLTGIIIKFKPLIIGGILFWLCGIICFLLPFNYQYFVAGLAMIIGYIIPGYLLKYKKEL